MARQAPKNPGPKDKAGKGGDKRARILDAALTLFEARGFDGVAVPEIAAAAGVATGSIYRHFADKAALVNALYRHWRSAQSAMVLADAPPGLSPHALFTRYWHRLTLFARTNPKAARFLELHHHGAYLDAESRAMEHAYFDDTEAFMVRLGANQDSRPLAAALAAALAWGAAAGLAKFSELGVFAFDADAAAEMGERVWLAIAMDNARAED